MFGIALEVSISEGPSSHGLTDGHVTSNLDAGERVVWRCRLHFVPVLIACGLCPLATARVHAGVDLQWRPARQETDVGALVRVSLFAVSDSEQNQAVGAVQVVLGWDPSRLMLIDHIDPCDGDECPPSAFAWTTSGFPVAEALNEEFDDGDAVYQAIGKFLTSTPALATPEGLHVTTFRFRTLRSGSAELRMVESFGETTRTMVISDVPGLIVTGVLGPPAEIGASCPSPTVSAIGSRYVAISPAGGEAPVALMIQGDLQDAKVACLELYVQVDGMLGSDRAFLTPVEWGEVSVSGPEIIPDSTYRVRTVCGSDGLPSAVSSPADAKTWIWCDVNKDGSVSIDDLTMVIQASQGELPADTILEDFDLAPCAPDGVVDDADIEAAQSALRGGSFPCDVPCRTSANLDDFADFLPCMLGPETLIIPLCVEFDSNSDGDIDLSDFAAFQALFDVQ